MSLYAIFARLFPIVAQTIMRRLMEQQQRKLARQRDAASTSIIETTPYRDGFDASGVPVSLTPPAPLAGDGDAVPLDKSKD